MFLQKKIMRKKIYSLLLLALISLLADETYKLRKKYLLIRDILSEENKELFFVNGTIKNKINYKDDELKISIENILGIKKDVYIYQLVESKKYLKKTNKYTNLYEKQWVKQQINSNNFTNKNIYTSKEIIPKELIFGNDYILENKFFYKKLKFENYYFNRKYIKGKYLNKSFEEKFVESNTYSDLDSYVSSNNGTFAKNEREKFKIIDGYILFNGVNFEEPEIGDTKIIYSVFSADFVSFLGSKDNKKLKPYKNFFAVDFEKNGKEEIVFMEKMKFIFYFFIFINTGVFIINKILLILKSKTYKHITLRYIPYFNEYFIYSKNHKLNILLLFSFLVTVIFNLYWLALFIIFTIIYLRNIDYYSI